MGLTTQYLRFVPGSVFGVIGNSQGNVLIMPQNLNCDHIAVGACENVVVWDLRRNQMEFELRGDKHAVTTIAQESQGRHLAAGYSDGSVRIFDLQTKDCVVMLSGHRSAVSCLAFDEKGFKLVSGGMDTEIVVWDVVDEAGLFRLKGHNGVVTQCHFLVQKNILVSCSKDGLMKFWDLDTQHCFKTLISDREEIWDMLVLNDARIFAATKDRSIFVYDIDHTADSEPLHQPVKRLKASEESVEVTGCSELDSLLRCVDYGQIQKENGKVQFAVDKRERLFGYHTFKKTLNLFKILSPEEIKKKLHKAKKKLKKLHQAEGKNLDDIELDVPLSVEHEIEALKPLKFPYNIVSFTCQVDKGDVAKLVLMFKNNCVSLYSININDKNVEQTFVSGISRLGHRGDIHGLAYNSDGRRFLSVSHDTVKLWNQDSYKCFGTLECEDAICATFVSANQQDYCLAGTKSGKIQVFHIGSRDLLENIEAHEGSIQYMCTSPDGNVVVTGGSDKNVKFWALDLILDEAFSSITARLTLVLERTLKMPEEVLCIKYSPNQKMLAVSLLDNSVKVLFADTLKFAFLLHGHRLPVRAMDISYDDSLIVTGSDDRNIKIWSMEFGSCNKSIFAHNGDIRCIKFLPKTHMFFSCSQDKTVKQWDADNFQKIITFEGHQSTVSALAISPDGTTVLSASNDRSIRTWERTQEPLVMEEEQEQEREAEMYKTMLEDQDPVIPGEYNKEVALAGRKTIDAIKSADQLIEALDIYKEETAKLEEFENQKKIKKDLPPPPLHPLFVAYSAKNPRQYMLEVMHRIKPNDRQQVWLMLPFSYAVQLLEVLAILTETHWDTEVCIKCIVFLIRIHFSQIRSTPALLPLIDRLRKAVNKETTELRNMTGFVLAALRYLDQRLGEETPVFLDVTERRTRKKKKKMLPVFRTT